MLLQTTKQYDGVTYMPCTPENNFFPDITAAKDSDIIMFCNPNNPTGACATRKQLEDLVAFAKTNGKVILFDSAYSSFITDPTIPKSIYEIEGAKECAIETTSFSKLAGFTGIRLGWVVCPSEVKFADGTPVKQDIARVMSTLFNGAANVSQVAQSPTRLGVLPARAAVAASIPPPCCVLLLAEGRICLGQNGGLAALNNMKEVMDIVGYGTLTQPPSSHLRLALKPSDAFMLFKRDPPAYHTCNSLLREG